MSAPEQAAAVRRGAGLFRLRDRGLVTVTGEDRTRWLDAMVSGEVAALGPDCTGSYSALLTRQGRMVTDLHVLWRPDAFWLELDAAAVGPVLSHLEKFVIADDVTLRDGSDAHDRLGLEGPAAPQVLSAAAEGALPGPDTCAELRLGDVSLVAAAFGWSGEPAFQLFVPRGSGDAVAQRLRRGGSDRGLVDADAEALEILRVEAGVPRYGAELDESVLPDEAGIGHAVSTTKGCYTGQEVVARLRSRGQVSHRLVGLRPEGDEPLRPGDEVSAEGRKQGEVTSACVSPAAGSIALAFVRRARSEPGSEVRVGGRRARVEALPFVTGGA